MHLASFTIGSRATYGVKSGDGVIDVAELDAAGGARLPATLAGLIEAGAGELDRLAAAVGGYRPG